MKKENVEINVRTGMNYNRLKYIESRATSQFTYF